MLSNRKAFLAVALCALVLLLARAKPKEQPAPVAAPEATDLAARVQAYVTATEKVRKDAKKEIPKGEGKPEEQADALEQQRLGLRREIRKLRPNPKPGEFFSAPIAAYIKQHLDAAFAGPAAATIRD